MKKSNKRRIIKYTNLFIAVTIILSSIISIGGKKFFNDVSKYMDKMNKYEETQEEKDVSSLTKPIENKATYNGTKLESVINGVIVAPEEKVSYTRGDYKNPVQKIDGRPIYQWTRKNSVHSHIKPNGDFEYLCPYTDKWIYGKNQLEYDHIIPVSYVNRHGGKHWSAEKKNKYYYDVTVGVDVEKMSNRIKSDKGPSEWLPDYNKEDYCYTWLVIANKYDISIAPEDMAVIKNILSKANADDLRIINEYVE